MPDEADPNAEIRQNIEDGRELEKIRETKGFAAVERIIKRQYDDLYAAWRGSLGGDKDAYTRDYCKGYAEALESLIPKIDEMIHEAKSTIEEERHLRKVVLPMGGGSGELA